MSYVSESYKLDCMKSEIKQEPSNENATTPVDFQTHMESDLLSERFEENCDGANLLKEEYKNELIVHNPDLDNVGVGTTVAVKNDSGDQVEKDVDMVNNDIATKHEYDDQIEKRINAMGKSEDGCKLEQPGSSKIKSVKSTAEKSKYCCEFCGKALTKLWDLKRHLLIHSGEKRHQCSICSKTFSRADNLKKHLHVHSGEKPHLCSICGKTFTESGSLKIHLRVHTGEKKHQCPICSKTFRESGSLKVHLRVHSGERPYPCSICSKTFTTAGHLRRHFLLHSGRLSQ